MVRSRVDGAPGTATTALDVAERLLQVNGYNGFAYSDIAAELGITRAALHYHFPGKSELGEALVDRYTSRFFDALDQLDTADAAAKLVGYVDLYTSVLRRHRMCLCGMLAAEYHTLPTGMQDRVAGFFDRNTSWLERVLEDGRRAGVLSFDGAVHDVAATVLGGLEGTLLISRIDGDVDRFRAAAMQLLTGLLGLRELAQS